MDIKNKLDMEKLVVGQEVYLRSGPDLAIGKVTEITSEYVTVVDKVDNGVWRLDKDGRNALKWLDQKTQRRREVVKALIAGEEVHLVSDYYDEGLGTVVEIAPSGEVVVARHVEVLKISAMKIVKVQAWKELYRFDTDGNGCDGCVVEGGRLYIDSKR